MKPEFIDNLEGNNLRDALRGHLRWARESLREPLALAVATAYFNADGFLMLADELEQLQGVRLLLGAEPKYPPAREIQMPGAERGYRRERARLAEAIASTDTAIRGDRNLLDFTLESDRAVRRLLQLLASGRVEVRRYERGFLHGKAFIFSRQDGVIVGSSNFTAAGLTRNLELNLGQYAPYVVDRVQTWFDALWEEATPFDLAAVYAERVAEHDPYLIFLRVLYELYGQELQGERDASGRLALTTFQSDGVFRAERMLREFHGVVIADGVGLGKTFIAGELMRRVREQRKRVLVVAPAALRDGTWRSFLHEHELLAECFSYEELASDRQLGGTQRRLQSDVNEYSLIVVDEAHAFRNPDTDRASALRGLLAGSPPKDLVLLTATPVNNSLWDIYYLLGYFLGHDAVLADQGIPSLKQRFRAASAQAPEDLRPTALFDILDLVTVRRTRHFVRRYYPGDRIRGPGGREMVVRFPDPVVRAVTYDFDAVLPGIFTRVERALDDHHGGATLSLARYCPAQYQSSKNQSQQFAQSALAGLIRSGLLKRFESSVHAFAKTLERMIESQNGFLRALEQGFVATGDAIEAVLEAGDTATDEGFVDLLRTHGSEPSRGYDVPRLRADVESDRGILQELHGQAAQVTRDRDPKLAVLVEALREIAHQADHDGASDAERRDNRKVLIFSYFADTVEWIAEHLRAVIAIDPALAAYRGRIAAVSGQAARDGINRDDACSALRQSRCRPQRAARRIASTSWWQRTSWRKG